MGFPSWGVLNGAMLLGLLGAAVPVVIHLLNRRRAPMIDWGAMQFLDLGRRARQKIQLTELLLMLARMAMLALVALALARPFWARSSERGNGGAGQGGSASPRDVVLVIDGSASMERKAGGTTPRDLAVRWAREFVRRLRPGDSVAVLVAGDRVRPLVDPPSFDRERVETTLAGLKAARGSSDLPAALVEAFGVLERTQNPRRDVVVLTDGQRSAWRAGEARRWELVRELRRRLPVPPRVWSIAFGAGAAADGPNGSVGPVSVSRTLATPGLPITVMTELANAGPGPLTRTAELLVDGRPAPGSAQVVGPIPAGGKAPLAFRTSIATLGDHLLAVRLVGDDALPVDDESALPIKVTAALPVLLIDGEPGLEPLSGETDFLRAALAPTGDDTPQVHATVVTPERFGADALKGQNMAVLANVDRLGPEQVAAVGRFLDGGGGLLIAPGDQTDASAWNDLPWMPARLGESKGMPGAREPLAHPMPRTFDGPLMRPFGQGDAPPLAEADFFAYRVLAPVPGSAVSARFDTGDPWVVERPHGRGRVLLLAAPLDAEAGTLPVNPDFVPLVHEWAFHLAGGAVNPRVIRPGEPLIFELDPPPAAKVTSLTLQTPGGTTVAMPVSRTSASARVRVDAPSEPGIYRLTLPDPPGGFAYASVVGEGRESDDAPLDPAEAAKLAEGWPLAFESDPSRLSARLFEAERRGRHEVWRALILTTLAGLCLEVYLTRRLVRGQGLAVA